MPIQFNLNGDKAQQVLLWILDKKPGIDIYNVMKVVFEADDYHLNNYASPIYGDAYEAWKYGTVPAFMYKIACMTNNVPYRRSAENPNGLTATAKPNMEIFSQTEIEALEYGLREYGDLSFEDALEKNHRHQAWKKHEDEVNAGGQHVAIPYEDSDFIKDPEVIEYLQDVGHAMVL